jgi:hypothetical protein
MLKKSKMNGRLREYKPKQENIGIKMDKNKTITKPKDFTWCHPEIAEALKVGRLIKCHVWDNGERHSEWVCDYNSEVLLSYRGKEGTNWKNAEPIKPKRVLRPFWECCRLLEENGWKIYHDDGVVWLHTDANANFHLIDLVNKHPQVSFPDFLYKEE